MIGFCSACHQGLRCLIGVHSALGRTSAALLQPPASADNKGSHSARFSPIGLGLSGVKLKRITLAVGFPEIFAARFALRIAPSDGAAIRFWRFSAADRTDSRGIWWNLISALSSPADA